MTTTTYKISNSNGMSGGVWGRSYDSRKAAAAAIAQAFGWDEAVLSPSWSDDEGNSCWSAYETQEECDADETGAQAPCITRREITVPAGRELPEDAVIVETMPDHLRGSHRAARNWGIYPANGAERRIMSRAEAEALLGDEPEYDHIVRDATPADAERYEIE